MIWLETWSDFTNEVTVGRSQSKHNRVPDGFVEVPSGKVLSVSNEIRDREKIKSSLRGSLRTVIRIYMKTFSKEMHLDTKNKRETNLFATCR